MAWKDVFSYVRGIAGKQGVTSDTRADDKLPMGARIGSLVQGELESPPATGLPLPVQALRRQDGQTLVWVVAGQGEQAQVRQRPVEVLREAAGLAWIGKGLKVGERVVTAGVNSLEEGQRVKDQEGARP